MTATETPETPPLCAHCARLMRLVNATLAGSPAGQWAETWTCPDGGWWLTRTVPAPPGYGPAPPALPPGRRARPRARRGTRARR
jgi:hypothetical protein